MSSHTDHQREFISLITQYQVALRSYIVSLMPGQDGVADVLQETNIVLWEKRENFEIGSNFTAWSYAIARFEVMKFRRKYKKTKDFLEFDEGLANELVEHCKLPKEELDTRMMALEQCMGQLTSDELSLIKHRYMKGSSLVQYATQKGSSPNVLRVTLHRVRKKLLKCVSYKLQTNEGGI